LFLMEVSKVGKIASVALGLGLLFTATAPAGEKPDADLAANAALKYWQAFSTMPKLDEKFQPGDVGTMPLDAKTKELVASAAYSLEQLHYGAALPRCVWAISLEEDGIRTLLPECQAARNLVALARLRIRLRFSEGKTAEAVDDAIDALTLGRHVSRDGTLIAVLVGIAIDQGVTDTLAADLPRLDAAALKKLAARLEALPPDYTAADAIRVGEERAGLDWFIRQVKATTDKDKLIILLEELGVSEGGGSKAKAEAFLEECGGTAEGVVKYAEQSRSLYAAAAQALALPPGEFEKAWDALDKKAAGNPVSHLLFPAVNHVRQAEDRLLTRRALRKAALAILIDGPDAAKTQSDPFGNGPFEYIPFDGGFELRSKFKAQDKPVSLMVGRGKEK
jgi:hypothetical protein